MDEPLRNDEAGDKPLTLHDCLAANVDDPATAAGRRLDWASVFDSLKSAGMEQRPPDSEKLACRVERRAA